MHRPVVAYEASRGQDTKRNFAHAKQFCSRNPLAGVSFRTFAFDYSQHGIFAQIQLHADLSVGLPGGYRYGILMEEAAEAENKKVATAYGHVPELPASLKAPVSQLLTKGAALERGFQTVLDAREPCDMWVEIDILEDQYQEWTAQRARLSDAFRSANMPGEAYGILMRVFEPMAQRIDQLHRRVIAKRH